ncbi:spoU rRNA Methylase family protein [Asticcacaulis biprosthecium C19]|uniref:SpoU rRNA Methylase family protein n=1 Tax=Asticcacaulis biprosthecium C19 TaxID=715226 RepID=F4QN94_9CAUL|nr:RNA methyltransferase [Asticcacaulis biprosthecium]EGF90802.1 spoU rRNA Methylase family protein [Asticcacaulis biprosthecium C19]
MKDARPAPPLDPNLTLPCVILDRPQLADNIGSVARVMANFGLQELRLVAPRDGWPQDRAWATSSGANWPLDGAKVFATVAEAVADLKTVYATTARNREVHLPVVTPRQTAVEAYAAAQGHQKTGLLFGAERAGLETSDIALCHAIVTIPVDPHFHSLNLAQAVNIILYEWRLLVMDAPKAAFTQNMDEPADLKFLHGLYGHLEDELEAAGFFFPPEKKESMLRNLRVVLNRARMTEQEIRTWRGVVTALTKGRGRVLAKLAKAKDET